MKYRILKNLIVTLMTMVMYGNRMLVIKQKKCRSFIREVTTTHNLIEVVPCNLL